jgi:hypothetical protein
VQFLLHPPPQALKRLWSISPKLRKWSLTFTGNTNLNFMLCSRFLKWYKIEQHMDVIKFHQEEASHVEHTSRLVGCVIIGTVHTP